MADKETHFQTIITVAILLTNTEMAHFNTEFIMKPPHIYVCQHTDYKQYILFTRITLRWIENELFEHFKMQKCHICIDIYRL